MSVKSKRYKVLNQTYMFPLGTFMSSCCSTFKLPYDLQALLTHTAVQLWASFGTAFSISYRLSYPSTKLRLAFTGLRISVRVLLLKLLYLFQSCNRLLLRRAIGCFASLAHASVSSDHTRLITRTRYLPVIIYYRPSFSLRSASGAPCQPCESVTTHLTHS